MCHWMAIVFVYLFFFFIATQTRSVLCQTGNETIDSSKCISSEMPPRRQRCQAQKCKGKWKSGRWSKVKKKTKLGCIEFKICFNAHILLQHYYGLKTFYFFAEKLNNLVNFLTILYFL